MEDKIIDFQFGPVSAKPTHPGYRLQQWKRPRRTTQAATGGAL